MNYSKRLTSSLIALALSMPAFAARPMQMQQQVFENETSRLQSLTDEQFRQEFTYKNAKGEKIAPKTKKDDDRPWALLDPKKDEILGTGTNRAYKRFVLNIRKRSEPIIVAVIDSGVDISHEDLQGHIWTNKKEIPNNGIDDDGNGYIDDVNGWNFLGGKDGTMVEGNTLEVTREYVRLTKKKSTQGLSPDEEKYFAQVTEEFTTGKNNAAAKYDRYSTLYTNYMAALDILKAAGLKNETADEVRKINSTDPNVIKAREYILSYLDREVDSAYIKGAVDYFEVGVKYNYNENFSASDIIGDDPERLDDIGYGNNKVTGKDAHGTHVSGIIAALRKNGIGMQGQAFNVQLMVLRAVPNGDERDKDIANAVRYAVDNGAKIINMSFGKAYSPNKDYVDAAFRYAEEHGVLVVHAAGNEGANTETARNFPTKKMLPTHSDPARELTNWIEVGASGKQIEPYTDHQGEQECLAATFSNYGKTTVDVFAPGVDILSSVPGNKYEMYNGTSMASPEVAGVAALVLSQRPKMTALQLRKVLLDNVMLYPNTQVILPGSKAEKVLFEKLSVTGGTIDAFKALRSLFWF